MNLNHASATAGRVMIAALFLVSGLGKASAPGPTIAYIQSTHLPFPTLAYAGATGLEIIGAIALILGFKTRWVAGALAVFSLVTAVVFHNNLADQNQMIHFLKNLAVTGGLLQVVAFGGGVYSVDQTRKMA